MQSRRECAAQGTRAMHRGLTMAALAAVMAVAACGGRSPVSIAEACTSGATYPKCQNERLVQIALEAAQR